MAFYFIFSEIHPFSFQLPKATNSTQEERRRRAVPKNYVKARPQHRINTTHGSSFLIRTRQVDSFVAILLDKEPVSSTDTAVSYILIELHNRYLKVIYKQQGETIQTLVDESAKLLVSNGKWVEVDITSSTIRVGNQTVGLTAPISIMINLVLMGGVDKPALYSSITNTAELLGCIQAAKVGIEFLTDQVIHNQQTVGVEQSPDVGASCPGAPVCQPNPCSSGGQCVDEWYDFSCNCQYGFGGKTCSRFGCSLNDTCQLVGSCVDVPLSNPPATTCKFLYYNSFLFSFNLRCICFKITKISLIDLTLMI